jgi:hypothetical protein
MRWSVAALVIGMVNVYGGSARAQDRRVLPVFDLVSPAGAVVASSALSNQAHWLLIYVSPDCGSCDRLISALEQWRPTLPADRIVAVIAGPRGPAHAYAMQHTDAAGIVWYEDADQTGARAMGLHHLPALVAVEHGRIAWMVTGVLNDPGAVEPIVRNWTAR